MWRHVTMVAKCLDHNNKQRKQQQRRGQHEKWKPIGANLQNNKFARVSHFFAHFLAVVARLRHETSSFHAPALWSRWPQDKNFLFVFLNLGTVPSDSTPEMSPTFDTLNGTEYDRWSFNQTACPPFLIEFSVCCHPKILLLWQCDVTTSSLYWCETIAKDRVQFISSMVTL